MACVADRGSLARCYQTLQHARFRRYYTFADNCRAWQCSKRQYDRTSLVHVNMMCT